MKKQKAKKTRNAQKQWVFESTKIKMSWLKFIFIEFIASWVEDAEKKKDWFFVDAKKN